MAKEIDRWEQMYILSKEVFNEELSRIHRLNDKVFKYFRVVPFVAGAYGYLFNKFIANPISEDGCINTLFIIFGLIGMGINFSSIILLLIATRITDLKKIDTDVRYFEKENLATIYYEKAKQWENSMLINRKIGNKIAEKLAWIDDLFMGAFIIYSILFIIYIFKIGVNNV